MALQTIYINCYGIALGIRDKAYFEINRECFSDFRDVAKYWRENFAGNGFYPRLVFLHVSLEQQISLERWRYNSLVSCCEE